MRSLVVLLVAGLTFAIAVAPADARRGHKHHRATTMDIRSKGKKQHRERLMNGWATDGVCETYTYPDASHFTTCNGAQPPVRNGTVPI